MKIHFVDNITVFNPTPEWILRCKKGKFLIKIPDLYSQTLTLEMRVTIVIVCVIREEG